MRWLDQITGTRPNDAFGVCVLKDAPATLAAPVSAFKPHVDLSACTVTAVLTTRTPDRQGDIVDPTGGDLSEHQTNPVVMFHHGKTHKLPIGKAEDRDGNYTVRQVKAHDGDVLIGTTHFAQSNRFAQDVFGLVAEDILRGVSIGFDPSDSEDSVEKLGASPILERPALHFKAWKLLEYSHTPIGVNRDALTVAIHKALDGSRKLHPQLLAMLQPLAAPRRTTVSAGVEKGMGCKGMPKKQKIAIELSKARKAGKKVPPAPVEKAMNDDDYDPDEDGDDDSTAAGDTDNDQGFDPTQDDPSSDPNMPDGAMPPEGDEMPPTAQKLTDAAQGLMDIASTLEGDMKNSEHMGGRRYCTKLCAIIRKAAAEASAQADKIHAEIRGGPDGNGTSVPDADGDGDTSDSNEEESEADMPETDEEGAIVKKGYSPRRWTFADVAGGTAAPQITATPDARELKSLKHENAELKRALAGLLEDIEAGKRRRN